MDPTERPRTSRNPFRRILSLYQPPPPSAQKVPPERVAGVYKRKRIWVLAVTMIGYATFYLVRKNLPMAMHSMETDLGISKEQLGAFLTIHGLLYGVSKFFNGFLADRAHPARFMATGLVLAALANVFFGLSGAVITFGLFWMINGYFQGMGFPPCARSITHWFSPSARATKFSIWNTSHSIGAALAVIMGGYLATKDWRLCFFVPAGIAAVVAFGLVLRLPDTPRSVGLPPVEEFRGDAPPDSEDKKDLDPRAFRAFLARHVFGNPRMWVLALANFFVYTVRYSIFDWGPTFLQEQKGVTLVASGWMTGAYEISGIVGMLVGGVVTDRLFKGRAGRASLVYMALCALFLLLFWQVPSHNPMVYVFFLCGIGFFIYGPQCLVGVIAANLATKRAAATAIGLTGIFGYASTILSGVGMGAIVEHFGWQAGFAMLVASAIVATLLFVGLWNVDPQTELKITAGEKKS